MKEQRHRILCAVCALALVLTAVLAPAAWAADGAGEVQDTAKPTLTTDDAAEMQQADSMQLKRIYDRVLELCPVRIKLEGESRRTQNAQQRLAVANDLLKPSART